MMLYRAATSLLFVAAVAAADEPSNINANAAVPPDTTTAAAATTPHAHHADPERAAQTTSTAPLPHAPHGHSGLPTMPDVRFTKWDHLEHEQRDHARKMGYNEKSWNKPGQFEAEKMDYGSLVPFQKSELVSLGITGSQWDCYVNHFRNYDWVDLSGGQQSAYTTLGWKPDTWDTGDTTEIEGKYWEDLTSDQRKAATSLCYTNNIWDEVAIPLWSEDDGEGGSFEKDDKADLYSAKETEVAEEKQDTYEAMYDPNDRNKDAFQGPASAHNDRGIEVPFFRYDPWDLLPADLKAQAINAGYDEKTWNDIGSHKIEKDDWETIGKNAPKKYKALKDMGFSGKQWDCYMSHYASYEWAELKEAGVQHYYEELGFSHRTWDTDTKPETDGLYWPDLTVQQQNAAYQLGYFREVWDEVSLQFWPRTTANTASLKAYAKQHPAAVGGGLATTLTLLVGMVFCCVYLCRSKKRSTKSDLEMFPSGFPGYSDDPALDNIDSSITGVDTYGDDDYNDPNPIV